MTWIVVHVIVDYYLDNNLDVVDEWKLRKMVSQPTRLKYIFIEEREELTELTLVFAFQLVG